MSMSDDIADAIALARYNITRTKGTAPYLARGLYAMTFIETDAIDTSGIDDRWRVYYNADYYRKCAADGTLAGELIHECLHVVLRHSSRAKAINATDLQRWNCCGDAELDQRIEEMKVPLVLKRVRPQDLGGTAGMPAEELYRLPHKTKMAAVCQGGSGVTGVSADWELPPTDAPAGLSQIDSQLVCKAVAAAIKDHQAAHGIGSVPGGLARWADEFGAPPPIPWDTLLGAAVRYAVDSKRGAHPSYARPSRRHVAALVLPIHRMPVPNVIVIGDTSGSMGTDDISKIVATVYGALEAIGSVKAIGCDSAATEPVDIHSVDDLRAALVGGGGTDMRIAIEAADALSPDAIVLVTDGDTPWPAEAPASQLAVVLTRENESPAWAHTILAE